MSVHQKDNGVWYVQWYEPGRQKRRYYTGKGPEKHLEAVKWDDLIKEKGIYPNPPVETNGKTFGELAQDYLDIHPMAESSRETIRLNLNKWVMPQWKARPVAEITIADFHHIDAAIARAVKKNKKGKVLGPYSVAYRNRLGAYCKAIFNWGRKRGLIDANPLTDWTPDIKAEKQAPDLITQAELEKIFAKAPKHLAWAMECILNLGVRAGAELFAIKMADIDEKQGGVWINRFKTDRGRPRRLQPVSPAFIAKLKKVAKADPKRVYLVEYLGKPVASIKKTWKSTLTVAGITRQIRLTDLRHLYCTTLVNNGTDIKTVANLMGHKTTAMALKIYHHATAQDMVNAASKLPEWQPPDVDPQGPTRSKRGRKDV